MSAAANLSSVVTGGQQASAAACSSTNNTGNKNGALKRTSAAPPLKIGTHNGVFHCDEVLACFLLQQLPEYRDAEIIRTRDPHALQQCDIVVDVGGVYDPEKLRFDHHQRSFSETFNSLRAEKPWKIKLSSAGLVFVHFGMCVLHEMTGLSLDSTLLHKMYDKVYENFVLEIDAIDNGVFVCDNKEPNYVVQSHLSSRVGRLNPWWNCAAQPPPPNLDLASLRVECPVGEAAAALSAEELQMARFETAMQMVGAELRDHLSYMTQCWWPARSRVHASLLRRFEVHPSGQIFLLDGGPEGGGLPWKSHFFDLEKENPPELKLFPKMQQHQQQQQQEQNGEADVDDARNAYLEDDRVLFCLYEDKSNNSWRIQTIPPNEKLGFDKRLPLPEEWCGLRDAELCKESGIEGCIFVHANGFIGGNATFDGALKMALTTLEFARNPPLSHPHPSDNSQAAN